METDMYLNLNNFYSKFNLLNVKQSPQFEEKRQKFKPCSLGVNCYDWETGYITEIQSGKQADQHGIQPGWQILRINRDLYEKKLLFKRANARDKFYLTFKIPIEVTHNCKLDYPCI